MLLIKDFMDIQKKSEYLLKLAIKLKEQKHGASTSYDQHLLSTMTKELYKFMKNKIEPEKRFMQDHTLIANEYREKVGAAR